MYDGPFSSLQEEMQYLMTMDEVYFGKTASIAAIEKQLDICRRKYIGTKLVPGTDDDFMKLNTMIENQFGFGNFCLYVTFDPIAAASTIPIEYNFSIEKKDNNYIIDAKSFRFKKEYNYTCMVIMTTGLIFNPEFTTEEIMACLLYELGQNFYSCFSHSNAILSNIYSITGIATQIAMAVQLYLGLSDFAKDAVDKGQKTVAQAMVNKDLEKDPKLAQALSKSSPEAVASFLADMNKQKLDQYKATDTHPAEVQKKVNWLFGGAILANFLVSPTYLKLQKFLRDKFTSNATVQSSVIGLMSYINLVGKYVLKNITTIYTMGAQLLSGVLFKGLTILDYIIPISGFITAAKNPMSWLAQPVNFRVEQAANNFPTMYGYAAPMVSYFEKMKSTKKVAWLSHFIKNNPFIGAMYDALLLPSKIIFSVFDSNPHNISRCHDQIKMLEAEFHKVSLPSKMKSTIMRDLNACKAELRKLIDISKGVNDPDIAKKLYNKALEDFMGGIGLRERLFSSKTRFADYDANIKAKMAESGVLPIHNDSWYVPIDESAELEEESAYVESALEIMNEWNPLKAAGRGIANFLTKSTSWARKFGRELYDARIATRAWKEYMKDYNTKTKKKIDAVLAKANGTIKRSDIDTLIQAWNENCDFEQFVYHGGLNLNKAHSLMGQIVDIINASDLCDVAIGPSPTSNSFTLFIAYKPSIYSKYLKEAKKADKEERMDPRYKAMLDAKKAKQNKTNECTIAMMEYLEPSLTLN